MKQQPYAANQQRRQNKPQRVDQHEHFKGRRAHILRVLHGVKNRPTHKNREQHRAYPVTYFGSQKPFHLPTPVPLLVTTAAGFAVSRTLLTRRTRRRIHRA